LIAADEQREAPELIRTLTVRGVAIILVAHILPDAFGVTDRIVVMHRGRKVTKKITVNKRRGTDAVCVWTREDTAAWSRSPRPSSRLYALDGLLPCARGPRLSRSLK
jgi:ABC-type sugar transport system ATPase subunit